MMEEELKAEFDKQDLTNIEPVIPEILKRSPLFLGFLKGCLSQLQQAEDANEQLYSQRNIFDALGKQLDDNGDILTEPRGAGESDERYRDRLLTRAANLFESGQIKSVKTALRGLTGESIVNLKEYYPAYFELIVTTDQVFSKTFTNKLNQIRAGGVNHKIIQKPVGGFLLDTGKLDEDGLSQVLK